MKKNIIYVLLAFMVCTTSCVKDKYDTPPTGCADPSGTTSNKTIAQLKSSYTSGVYTIATDDIIEGVVTANDESGNFYKTIIIQDASAGIAVLIDQNGLATEYPVGRKVFIKCKGLYLGSYNGLIQLGGSLDNSGATPTVDGIPSTIVADKILKGSCNNTVTPLSLPISGYNASTHQNMLIKITGVEFDAAELNKTFADAVSQSSANRVLNDCSGGSIELRTSGFANFAADTLPSGKGDITAIFQVFGTSPQLYVRNTSDLTLTGTRCGGGGGGPVVGYFEDFQTLTTGAAANINGWQTQNVSGGTVVWKGNAFGGDSFAEAKVFSSGEAACETWLISPSFNLATYDTLEFLTQQAFFTNVQLSVYISTNFDGTNIGTATWNLLTCSLPTSATANYTDVASGAVSLTGFSGSNAYIGFKYVGDDVAGQTTTYRVDDVNLH